MWYFIISLHGCSEGTTSCSTRGTNNQLVNRFNKFVYSIQLFNVKCKFVHLQLFTVKFLFTENHIFRKQKRTAVYGHVSLVLDLKLARENDELLSSRHKNKSLRYRTLWTSILKCRFPTKSIKLTRFALFEVLGVPQF